MVIHGECLVYNSELPTGAKKLKAKGYKIIANSEVTGNHHVIDATDGVEFYEHEGTIFVRNTEPATVRCLVKERHDDVTLQPGTWKIDFQQEYDYLSNEARVVRD
jgi:hypothetical protein